MLTGLFLCLLAALWVAAPAHAAPPATTPIGNQASATYVDSASGQPKSALSNSVTTTVQQVAGVALSTSNTQTVTAGTIVYLPHTITNTGNASDSFTISVAGNTAGAGKFVLQNVQVYADNGSGAPQGAPLATNGSGAYVTPLVSSVSGSNTYRFLISGTVPATAANNDQNVLTVSAASAFNTATVSTTQTDTTTVTSNAVIRLTKTASVNGGAPGTGPYTFTISYTNQGNSPATNVTVTDTLPASLVYQPGGSTASLTGSTALFDASSTPTTTTNGSNSVSSFCTGCNTAAGGTTNGGGTFTVNVGTVAPGQSGTITLTVRVATAAASGTVTNTANATYATGVLTGVAALPATKDFVVSQVASVQLTAPVATTVGPNPPVNGVASGSNTGTATAGGPVYFLNTVKNNGNGPDTFNITVDQTASTFPAGTTFQLLKSDGATPLTDTNGDGTPDTGLLAAGATYVVVLRAQLPANAPNGNNGGNGFTIPKTATSVVDGSKTSTGTDRLNSISGASVDLYNKNNSGTGAGPETAVQLTQSTNPGAPLSFVLVVKNTGPIPDAYDLSTWANSALSTALPTGWTVSYKADAGAGDCLNTTNLAGGNANTGTVAPGATLLVCAIVTPASNALANAGVDVYFAVKSAGSGASDALHDAVGVNAVRGLTISPPSITGQAFPNGSTTYFHTLTNTGNVTEGGVLSTINLGLTDTQSGSGWTSVVYLDNGSTANSLDPGDTALTSTGSSANLPTSVSLAPGASVVVIIKVVAPPSASPNFNDITKLTVTLGTGTGNYVSAPAPVVATDTTNVIVGNLRVVKEQSVDSSCAGNFGAASWTQNPQSALPGQCILYRITVQNVGSSDATNVSVADSTPQYTKVGPTAAFQPAATNGVIATSPAAPTINTAGSFAVNAGTGASATQGGTLSANQTSVITFGVRIDP